MICIYIGAPYCYGYDHSRCDSKPESTLRCLCNAVSSEAHDRDLQLINIIYATLSRARPMTAIYTQIYFGHLYSCTFMPNCTFTPRLFRMPEIVGKLQRDRTFPLLHCCGQILILTSANDGILF